MIEYVHGNLLEAPAQALVNTVNTEGVMGKGIALQFRRAFPDVNTAYERACAAGEVRLGRMHIVDRGGLAGDPRWVINFPTKGHWRARSKLVDIEKGLEDLRRVIVELGIESIAIPPLGCGHGGLLWSDVRPRIENAFRTLPNTRVLVFPPEGAPAPAAMPTRTVRPEMTVGRATLIAMIKRYQQGLLDPLVTLLEVHKLAYFMQAAGEPLRLCFDKGRFGPFAKNLRQVLIRLEGHFISGYGDGQDRPNTQIELIVGASGHAEAFLRDEPETVERIRRVTALIEGYEDPYGLELLSTLHWVMQRSEAARESADAAIAEVFAWNDGKRERLKADHLRKAWERLQEFSTADGYL